MEATPAILPSARRLAGSLPTEVMFTLMGFGLPVAASKPTAVSELAAGREHHATTRLTRPNGHSTNIRRGFGCAGTCPEPRCITIAPAGCREAATSTSAAAAVRRTRCAQLSRHQTSFCRQRLRDRALLLRRLLCYVSNRQSSHPAFSSPPRATRHPRLSSRPANKGREKKDASRYYGGPRPSTVRPP